MFKTSLLVCALVSSACAQGSATSYGTGCSDAMGRQQGLAASPGPVVGNAQFSVTLTLATPGLQTYLFLALAPATPPVPLGGAGCELLLDPSSLSFLVSSGISPMGPVPATSNGSVAFPLPIPNIPSLSGTHIYFQGAVIDPALGLGFNVTHGLDVLIG